MLNAGGLGHQFEGPTGSALRGGGGGGGGGRRQGKPQTQAQRQPAKHKRRSHGRKINGEIANRKLLISVAARPSIGAGGRRSRGCQPSRNLAGYGGVRFCSRPKNYLLKRRYGVG